MGKTINPFRSDMIYLSWWNFHIYFSLLEGVCVCIYIYMYWYSVRISNLSVWVQLLPPIPILIKIADEMSSQSSQHRSIADSVPSPCWSIPPVDETWGNGICQFLMFIFPRLLGDSTQPMKNIDFEWFLTLIFNTLTNTGVKNPTTQSTSRPPDPAKKKVPERFRTSTS